MKDKPEIAPVFVDGEPMCSGEKCLRYEAFCAGQSSIVPVLGKPCVPGLRQQRNTAAKEVMLDSVTSLDDQVQVNARLISLCLVRDAEIVGIKTELDKALRDLENKEFLVQEKTCSECQREAELENRQLEGKLSKIKEELEVCLMERDAARGKLCSKEAARKGTCLAFPEPYKSFLARTKRIAASYGWQYLYSREPDKRG